MQHQIDRIRIIKENIVDRNKEIRAITVSKVTKHISSNISN